MLKIKKIIFFIILLTLTSNSNFNLKINKAFNMNDFLKVAQSKGEFFINIDGRKEVFKVKKVEKHRFGIFTIKAGKNTMGNHAILTVQKNRIIGFISFDNKEYKVSTTASGKIKLLDKSTMQKAPFNKFVPTPAVSLHNNSLKPKKSKSVAASAGLIIIDLMVLYTQDFKDEYGDDTNMTILNIVEIANESLKNSDIKMNYFLVYTQLDTNSEFDESNDNGDVLTSITNDTDTQNLRDEKKADMVSIFRDYKGNAGCGIAWLMGNDYLNHEEDFNSYTYSVIEVGESGNYYCDSTTFAHESGHNLGCTHDLDHGGGDGLFSYSNGHDFDSSDDSEDFATIMSYDSPTIHYYSNPDITYKGTKIGVQRGEDGEADCSATIEYSHIHVSQFRSRVGCPSGYHPAQDSDTLCVINYNKPVWVMADTECDTISIQGKTTCDEDDLTEVELKKIKQCDEQGISEC